MFQNPADGFCAERAHGSSGSAMRRLRSWLRHERQTVALELAPALHHSRDARSEVAHDALRGQKAASSGEEAGVVTHNTLRGLKTLPPGMRSEQLPEAPGTQRCVRTVRGTSVGAPLLAVQSLRGFDGVDDTAARFLLRQALKKEEEEEKERKEGEEGEEGVACAPEGGHGRDARAARYLASHSCPAGEGGCADSGAGRHRCRQASFPPHEEEEEEEEEEKDDAASLIPLDVFSRPLVSGSHLFYLVLA